MKTNQRSRLVCRHARKKPDVLATVCYVQHGTEFKHLVANQVNGQELKQLFSLIHA